MKNNDVKDEESKAEPETAEGEPGRASATLETNARAPQNIEKKPTSPFAVASLVLGIVAVVVSFIPFSMSVSLILGIVGLVLAIVGMMNIRKGKSSGNGMAIAGLVLSIIAIAIYVLAYFTFVNAVNQSTAAINNAAKQHSKIFD